MSRHELSTILNMCLYVWGFETGGEGGLIRKYLESHLYFASCGRLSMFWSAFFWFQELVSDLHDMWEEIKVGNNSIINI